MCRVWVGAHPVRDRGGTASPLRRLFAHRVRSYRGFLYVLGDFKPKAAQAHHLARRTQHTQLTDTQVSQYLCAEAKLTPFLLLHFFRCLGHRLAIEAAQQGVRRVLAGKHQQRAAAFIGNAAQP